MIMYAPFKFFIIEEKDVYTVHRGSYMSAHVLLNLLNELEETSLINSIIQEHEC